jgi:tripartite-type tricarboxylate transporter receptor subunit TctC
MSLRIVLLCSLVAACATSIAHAQSPDNYPARPVRLVVPFTVGGSADTYARLVSNNLSESWGRQVVVDNRAGSNGIIGTDVVAKSQPDGYTLLLGTGGNIATNPVLYKRLPYRPQDFAPVAQISSSPFVLLTPLSLPVTNVRELIAMAKARPGQLNYVSTGIGSPGHLTAALLAVMTNVSMVHVPYRSHGTMMADMAAGQVHLWFNGIAPAQAQVRGGKVRALAVSGAVRARALPNVPTIAESGVPGYAVVGWYGVFVPSGTPQRIVEKLHSDTAEVLRKPQVQERLLADGAEIAAGSSAQFRVFVTSEMRKWADLVSATGITAD